MHQQDAAHTFPNIFVGVEHRFAGLQRTGINPEERQLADVGIRRNLERQSGERRAVVSCTGLLFLGSGIDAGDRGLVKRRRQEIDDRIEELLNALVFVGRAAENGDHLIGDGRSAQRGPDLRLGDLFSLEIEHHDFFVLVRDLLEHMIPILRGKLCQLFGDLFLAHILAQLVVEDIRLHADQIDDAAEGILRANGQLKRNCRTLETVVHHFEDIEEIGAHHVHFVDVNDTRDMIFVGLSPYSLGLRLHAALCTKDGHRAVEHAQGTFDLNGEVHMSRRVDDVDAHALPVTGRRSRGDRDATLLLLLHPVHGSGAVMGLSESVIDTGVEKNTLCRRRLSCIDMSHDANVSRILK